MRRHTSLLGLVTALAGCSMPGLIGVPDTDAGLPGPIRVTDGGVDAGRPGPTGTDSGCAPDTTYFEEQVWSRVLATRCATCHGSGGVANGTRMVFVAASLTGAMEKNLAAATGMALATEEGQPLLLRRPAGTNHVGGLVTPTDSAEYAALADFTGRVRGDPGACQAQSCKPGDPGPRLLRRLSRTEYDNTLKALFGVSASYAPTLVADVVVNGFDNAARALTVSPLLADQLRKAAEEVAATVAAKPELACVGDGATCARAYLQGSGSRVFRRPLSSAEVTRWLAVYQVGRDTAPSTAVAHQSGMELMLSGLLQSPAFLYRSELGLDNSAGGYALTSYEIASELSYFLWASPPDDTLWDLAASDGLRDAAAIATQARRLIASPRARGALDRFTAQWLTVDQLAFMPKDATLYAVLTDQLRAEMREEVARLVASVVQRGGTLSELITAHTTHVNANLAKFYGITAPSSVDASGFGEVTARSGVLGTGAVLTAHARPNGSSPISRGKLVREQLLCQVLPTPPSGVVAQPPAPDASLTTRQRYTEHSSNPACFSCHRLVDPIGWGFEHYDGIGRYRATEGTLAIDDSGEILSTISTDATFRGLDELSSRLAASTEVASCFALEWTRFAYALGENARTSCLTDEVRRAFAGGDGAIDELLVALTQTSQFRFRAMDSVPVTPGTSDAGVGPTTPDAGGGAIDAGSEAADAGGGPVDAGGGPVDAGQWSDPDVTPGVTTVVAKTNEWSSGYCATVTVTNTTGKPIAWRVRVSIEGTIYDHWNLEIASQSGTSYVLTGVSFNASVPAGATAEGGFCARL